MQPCGMCVRSQRWADSQHDSQPEWGGRESLRALRSFLARGCNRSPGSAKIPHQSFSNDKEGDREADLFLKKLCLYRECLSWPNQFVSLKHPEEVNKNKAPAKSSIILVLSYIWFIFILYVPVEQLTCTPSHIGRKTVVYFSGILHTFLSLTTKGVWVYFSEKPYILFKKLPRWFIPSRWPCKIYNQYPAKPDSPHPKNISLERWVSELHPKSRSMCPSSAWERMNTLLSSWLLLWHFQMLWDHEGSTINAAGIYHLHDANKSTEAETKCFTGQSGNYQDYVLWWFLVPGCPEKAWWT